MNTGTHRVSVLACVLTAATLLSASGEDSRVADATMQGDREAVRTLLKQDFDAVFQQVDVLAAPVSPTTAFRLGERTGNPLQMYAADMLTLPASMAGVCGISVPCGFDEAGLPIGLQLIGPAFGEEKILQAAYAYEQATDWQRFPEVVV